jgi:hypothetical protein
VIPVLPVDESSFGTDFSMIEPSDGPNRIDGKEPNVDEVLRQNMMLTRKVQALQMEKDELASSLMQLTPILK